MFSGNVLPQKEDLKALVVILYENSQSKVQLIRLGCREKARACLCRQSRLVWKTSADHPYARYGRELELRKLNAGV